MSTKLEVLRTLNDSCGTFISGQEIANAIGVSRNSVWKAVKSLQSQGFDILSSGSEGYCIVNKVDVLSKELIADQLKNNCDIYILDSVDSTNNFAKTLACSQRPQLVISDCQTQGKGRLGRCFSSPAGKGLYLSIAISPDMDFGKAMLVTCISALATVNAIQKVTGLSCTIKWVNDIFLGEKKVCGILTEAESNLESGKIDKIIVGIGVNCFETDFPEEIKSTAGYLANPPKSFDRNQLAAAIVNEFMDLTTEFDQNKIIHMYRSRSNILGHQIKVFNPSLAKEIGRSGDRVNEGIRARAIDIDDNGGLIIELLEGKLTREMRTLNTGEITIRKL